MMLLLLITLSEMERDWQSLMQMGEKYILKTDRLGSATRFAMWQQRLKSESEKLSNHTCCWLFPSSDVATPLLLLAFQPVQVCLFIKLQSHPHVIALTCLQMIAALVLEEK